MIDPVDPKLKEAAKEIKAILQKYDVAAVACLCSGERIEYINHILLPPNGPEWSAISIEDNRIRVKAKASRDHKERWRLNLTAKMIFTMRDLMALQFDMFDRVGKLLEDNMRIEHGERAHEPGGFWTKQAPGSCRLGTAR